jgi:hypothetical protein
MLLAACQTGQAPAPSVPVASTPPTGAPSPSPVEQASPSPVPAAARVQVSGKVFADDGRRLENARVEVRSSDGQIVQTLQAIGGAYALPEVPVGTVLTLTAVQEGYSMRQRVHRAVLPGLNDDLDPNVVDFGGPLAGAYHALSLYPEITSVTPAARATNVASSPLVITFRLSHALPVADQGRFGRVLQVRFPVPVSPTHPTGEVIIRRGTAYEDTAATLTWNEAGTEGTFRFDAPLVTRAGGASAVTVGFDQGAPLEDWPENAESRRLGRDRAVKTYDGNGSTVSFQVAPFWRGAEGTTAPATRPSPLEIWGSTHATTTTFSLAPDTRQPKVKQVAAYSGKNGANDEIHVVFDEPMRGFPEEALDNGVLLPSSYRFVLGRTEEREDAERYAESDPAEGGNSPPLAPFYSINRTDTVILPLPNGTLTNFTVFKLYVDSAVKDLAGNAIQTSPRDPSTGLADHILEGRII